jgi:hypothetical protein
MGRRGRVAVFLGWNEVFSGEKRLADDCERDKAGGLFYRWIGVVAGDIGEEAAGKY